MDFTESEEIVAMRDTIRKFVAREFTADIRERDLQRGRARACGSHRPIGLPACRSKKRRFSPPSGTRLFPAGDNPETRRLRLKAPAPNSASNPPRYFTICTRIPLP